MSPRSDRSAPAVPARSWRVAGGTTVPLTVGSIGHAAAGGSWSAPPVLAVAVLLLGPLWVLSRRELGMRSIAAVLVSGQLATHAALMLDFPHHHDIMARTAAPAGPMVLYHLGAALITGWWLRQAERRLWEGARRVIAAVYRYLRHLLHDALATSSSIRFIPTPEAAAWQARITLRHAIVLRAPPARG